MLEKIIIVCVAYVLYFAFIIAIPFRRNNAKKNCGKCLLSFSQKINMKNISILVFAAAIILVVFFLSYKTYVNIILAACGVLGSYISTREITFCSFYGVYEKGFFADGSYIPYEKISSIIDIDNRPVTNEVYVTFNSNKTKTVSFASEEEKNITLNKLRELKVI